MRNVKEYSYFCEWYSENWLFSNATLKQTMPMMP